MRALVIEQFYEDAKQECGLDDYQGRHWDGLHRHLALVTLAYSFLMFYRLTLPLPPEEAFSPCVTRSSLPGVHRQVLLWLFQDLVLWLLRTRQIETFRPRRNMSHPEFFWKAVQHPKEANARIVCTLGGKRLPRTG